MSQKQFNTSHYAVLNAIRLPETNPNHKEPQHVLQVFLNAGNKMKYVRSQLVPSREQINHENCAK